MTLKGRLACKKLQIEPTEKKPRIGTVIAICRLVQDGAEWCTIANVAKTGKPVRLSVSLPEHVAEQVRIIAKRRGVSANRVLVDLIEAGLEFRDAEKKRFWSLTSRLAESRDRGERQRIQRELARMTFGDEKHAERNRR